jgi:hypothetical protein
VIKNEQKQVGKNFYKKLIAIVILLGFILLPVFLPRDEGSWLDIGGPIGKIVYTLRILLTVFVCGLTWFLVIVRSYERNVYEGVLREINLDLHHGRTSFRLK